MTSLQPGSQFAANYAVSYAVSPTPRLGVAGYALRQSNDAEVGGNAVPRSQQQAFGIGPGLLWAGGKAKVIANVPGVRGREPAGRLQTRRSDFVFRDGLSHSLAG